MDADGNKRGMSEDLDLDNIAKKAKIDDMDANRTQPECDECNTQDSFQTGFSNVEELDKVDNDGVKLEFPGSQDSALQKGGLSSDDAMMLCEAEAQEKCDHHDGYPVPPVPSCCLKSKGPFQPFEGVQICKQVESMKVLVADCNRALSVIVSFMDDVSKALEKTDELGNLSEADVVMARDCCTLAKARFETIQSLFARVSIIMDNGLQN